MKDLFMFPIGARIFVDGRDEAIVQQAFPEGSHTHLFPHYKLKFLEGERNVVVATTRVGTVKRVAT